MKKNYLFLTIFALCGLFVHAQENLLDKPFYYYKGEKFYLEVDYSRITVISEGKFNAKIESKSVFSIKNESKSCTKQSIVLLDEITEMVQDKENFITEIEFPELLKRSDYYGIIQQFSKENDVVRVMPAYITSGQKLGISNNFYVKLFKKEDEDKLFELAKKYSVQVLGYNEFMPLWFTLSCNRETTLDAIDAANTFYETGLFECAEPELLYHNLLASNDPYFANQWGLKNTGQYCNTSNIDIRAESAWDITKGSSNIRVAVFDQGIKMDHPDLINNIHGTGYDAQTNTTPSVLRGSHGASCAGIIGSQQNNTIGASGVAPNTELISISLNLDWNNTAQQLANGFNWAWQNGADVISNSWGGYAPSGIIDNAIINTLTQGRNGKGTVVVFASGNENNTSIRYPGNSNSDILAVGAIAPDGGRKSNNSCDGEYWWGSCYGTQLDVVAPGVFIPTTTYTGGYTQTFNGTSSACPHVAGIAALVLSVNPNLTGQQVRDIIESTAQKVRTDLYTYSTTPEHPNGIWHEEMGYGLVDAYAAVQAAQCYSGLPIVQGAITQNTILDTPMQAVGTLTIPDGVTLTITSEVKCSENVQITVEPGGKLIVSGGILTNACPNTLWKGVIIEGTTTTPQSEQTQGSVILTDATIENALVAVNAALVKGGSNGGIIRATNTNFINNVQAINYGYYESKDLNGAVIDNMGAFTQCIFSIDGNNYFVANGQTFEQHVKLNRVRGIKFYGCTFNSETDLGGKGIYAMNAGFTVREHCTVNVANNCPCPENANTPSLFSHLTCGIHAENTGNPYLINIDQSVFDHNIGSVSINASSNYSITRNRFSNILLYGVSSNSSSGYRMEENYFTGAPGTARPTAGIRMNNSGAAENSINRNGFKNLDTGISVTHINGSLLSSSLQGTGVGLQFSCNKFSDNAKDIYAAPSSIIRSHQGSLHAGADNLFLGTSVSSLSIENTQSVFYFHSSGNTDLKPYQPTPNITVNYNAFPGKCVSTLCTQVTATAPEIYQLMQQEYDALLAEYEANGYGTILANINSSGEYSEQEMAALQFSAKISELSNRMRELSDNAISIILHDSVLNTDLLKEWYSVVRTPFAKYALAETHLFTGSYAEADATLRHIPAQFALSDFEQTEYDSYMQFHNFKTALQLSGREWSELNDGEIATLQSIAQENTGRGSAMAKGVLCFFYGICYEDEMPEDMPEQTPPSMTKAAPQPDEKLQETSTVSVYPNPFGTEITVTVNSPKTVITRVELYDAFGNSILHQAVNQMQKTVSTDNISTGIYVLKTYLSNGEVDVRRVIKN